MDMASESVPWAIQKQKLERPQQTERQVAGA